MTKTYEYKKQIPQHEAREIVFRTCHELKFSEKHSIEDMNRRLGKALESHPISTPLIYELLDDYIMAGRLFRWVS